MDPCSKRLAVVGLVAAVALGMASCGGGRSTSRQGLYAGELEYDNVSREFVDTAEVEVRGTDAVTVLIPTYGCELTFEPTRADDPESQSLLSGFCDSTPDGPQSALSGTAHFDASTLELDVTFDDTALAFLTFHGDRI